MNFEEQLRKLTQDDNYSIEFSKRSESCWIAYTDRKFFAPHFGGTKELEHFITLLKELKNKVNLTTETVGDIARCMSMAISHWCYSRRDNVTDEVIEEVATNQYFIKENLPLDIKKYIIKHILDSITVQENTYVDSEGCTYNSCTLN